MQELRSTMTALDDRAEREGRDLSGTEQDEFDQAYAAIQPLLLEYRSHQRGDVELAAEGFQPDGTRALRGGVNVRPDFNEGGSRHTRAGDWLAREVRALVGSGVTGGGAFTPADAPSTFFDLLAAKSVALRSGIRRIMTDRDTVIVPRLSADAATGWVSEAATISEASPTADQVTAVPRKLAGLIQLSNELIADADPNILEVAGQSIVRSIGLKLDNGIYEGSGSPPQITGLKNVAGINTVSMGTNGLTPVNLDAYADAIATLESFNSEASVIVMHPRSWQTLIKIKEITGSVKPLLQESAGAGTAGIQRSLYGVPVLLSSQFSITETQGTSTDCSSAYVYEASQLVLVARQQASVRLDQSRLFNSDQSELRCTARFDLVVPNVKAVVRILGIRP
jgi:HK97 family phage major capsid protein